LTGFDQATGRAGTVLVANPSADLYGSDRMMLESVRGLLARGWRVVVTCSDAGPLMAPLEAAGADIRVEPVPVLRKAMLNPKGLVDLVRQGGRSALRMRRMLREERPDVVLVNTLTIPLWLVVARLARQPVVVHVHEAEGSLARPKRLALTAPLALATMVIYNSEVSRRVSGVGHLERRGRTRVIHNGVRGPDQVSPARRHLDEEFRLVYVGRLSPRKGVDLILTAARQLTDGGVPTTVDLVGSVFPGYEWYEQQLRDQVRVLQLDQHVHFRGFQDTVWPYLAAADVAVVPSRLDESFGNVVIESLLAARPVVTADHTGLREAARGFTAAVLTATDDPVSLAERLLTVHDEWDDYRLRAEQDADTAHFLYSPARFHSELAETLSSAARGRQSVG
jgi:glycosyltransferase involved in cell wall biosynthesis